MSLEDNITELTLAVNRLITALDVTTASVTPAPIYEVELEAPAPKKAKPELKAVPTKEVEVNEAPAEPAVEHTHEKLKAPTEPTVEHTHEKLKALCLDLVRKDPENRDKIKKIISSFDESTLVSDVADTKLPSLARQLLALAS
jgi:hypothetical protein